MKKAQDTTEPSHAHCGGLQRDIMQSSRAWLFGFLVGCGTAFILSLESIKSIVPFSYSSGCKQVTSTNGEQPSVRVESAPPSAAPRQDVYFINEWPDIHEQYCAPPHSDCFEKTWPDIQKALCPEMVPNVSSTDILFTLARDEVGLRQWNGTEKSIQDFYVDSARLTTGFVYRSPENKSFVYMSIWKAAHEAIVAWGEQTIKPLSGFYQVPQKPALRKFIVDSTDPCIVTMVRDPVSHFLSGYNEIETRIKQAEYKQHDRMKTAPKALFHRYHYGTKARFEQFVADILSQPYSLGWNEFDLVEPLHFYSMSGALHLLSTFGAKMTAYLPTMENFLVEWPKFAFNTCPEALPGNVTAPFNASSSHLSSKDPFKIYEAAKNVWNEGGPTARAICVLQAIDYACWENLPDGIPLLCKEVYASRNFVHGILNDAAS